MNKLKIKKGDTVIVIAGADKGKEGKVLRAFPKNRTVLVEGVHIQTHHVSGATGRKAELVKKATPVPVSRVLLKDPKTGKPTRTSTKLVGGKKVRIATKSGQEVK